MTEIKNLLILAGCFCAMLLTAGIAASGVTLLFESGTRDCYLAQSALQNIIAFCATSFLTAFFISRTPLEFLGLGERVDRRPFLGVIIVFILAMPAMNQLIYYNSLISLPDSLAGVEEWMRNMEQANAEVTEKILSANSVSGLISGILFIGVLTGFSEELLFRGTLQNILTRFSGLGKWAIWISAFIFSAVHLQFYGFFPRLLLGAFFGYTLYSTRSIWPTVFAHALNNSLVVAGYWVTHNYSEGFSIDNLGVTAEGFPIIAGISAVATILFFIRYYKFFFNGGKE